MKIAHKMSLRDYNCLYCMFKVAQYVFYALVSSFLLFKEDMSGLWIMKYFSSRQRLHILLDGE